MLKTLGILAWGGCLLTLAWQGIAWAVTGSRPSLTLMNVLGGLFGLDLPALALRLPLDIAAKAAYVLATTELALFLWWAGAAIFGLMFALGLLRRK
ncbi:potassium:proton antiporter [Desulfovibrio sp. Fe33]|uniref:potassium:proton antiporter n=1 Tax=Desulfovibrio sp. Fe33 TaxID=3020842 RepID=UPI00234CDD70|nr:potassium:proton antiporter [Desulfovibrio sp. Fe33]